MRTLMLKKHTPPRHNVFNIFVVENVIRGGSGGVVFVATKRGIKVSGTAHIAAAQHLVDYAKFELVTGDVADLIWGKR